MAHRRSSIKKIRVDERRRTHNNAVRSQVKSAARKAQKALATKKYEDAVKAANLLFSQLDKSVKKNIIHKNRASRTRSRIQLRLNALKKSVK